jgi:Zn-dependent M28 family amino/carboxypeptidase
MVNGELVGLTPEQTAAINVNLDSLRQLRPARFDSISNGADDDGSGSMALLEIAEAFAGARARPRRSLILIWNNSEEGGLNGSRWFVDHPTVPREAIVANLNMDMIGRGRAEDVPGGSDDLLFVIGSYRDSRELGDLVAEVNRRQERPLALSYRLDEPSDWPGYNNLYGRSDHANYARVGIPIAFFFTGLHYDYHRVTDEPQYIHYPKLERIARYVHDVALEVANRERRPAMNPPDSTAPAP